MPKPIYIPTVIREIKEALAKFARDHPRGTAGDTDWTHGLKCEMSRIGRSYEYDICPSAEDQSAQWLYDLVWYSDAKGHLDEVDLVYESEWKQELRHIKYDFEKLLLAKSRIKVMVFQDRGDNVDDLFAFLQTGIGTFKAHGEDETYLLAAFIHKDWSFRFSVCTGEGCPI